MFIYTEGSLICKFCVTNLERFKVIHYYEMGYIKKDDMEYNMEFTKLTVSLKNIMGFNFIYGQSYDLLITKKGIECVWDSKAPKYIREKFNAPKKETLEILNLHIDDLDFYYSSDSEYEHYNPVSDSESYNSDELE